MSPPITAEQNRLSLEEARAKLQQLRRTFDLKRRADAADLRSLEIQRDRAKNAWSHAEENAGKMRVVSPIDGMVVLKTTWKNGTMGEVQEGEEVRAGLPILDVVDSSEMRVRARVNQADVNRLRLGQTAQITLDSYPSRTFGGRLEQLSHIGATSTMSNSRAHVPRGVLDCRHRSASDAGSRRRDRRGRPMTRSRRGARCARRRWRRCLPLASQRGDGHRLVGAAAADLPSAVAAKDTFVDFLQLRGEIRPVHSVVLTAPSSGTDLQIVDIVKNGATVCGRRRRSSNSIRPCCSARARRSSRS